MTNRRCLAPRWSVWLLLAGWLGAAPVFAQPSALAPDLPLEVLPVGEGPVWREQIVALNRELLNQLATIDEKFRQATMNPGEVGLIGQAAVLQYRLDYAASRLELLGEPCGADFRFRSSDYLTQVRAAARQMTRLRGFRLDLVEKELQNLFNAQNSRLRVYQQLADSGKLEETETQLLTVLANIHRWAVFFEDYGKYYQPFQQLLSQIREPLDARRRAAHDAALAQAIAQWRPSLDQSRNDLVKCLAELQTGPCVWQGEKLNAVELAEKLPANLKSLHLAALRVRGLQIALFPPGLAASERQPAIDAEYANFHGKFTEMLVGLVRLSAASTPPAEASALHRRWLNALTAIGLESWDQAQLAPLQAALDSLAAKEPGLPARSQRYAAATSDYLRWRERTTALQARFRHAKFPPLANLLSPVLRSHDGAQYLLGPQAPMTQSAVLMRLDAVARELGAKLPGQPAAAAHASARPGVGLGVARYASRSAVLMTVPPSPRLAQAELRLRERLLCDALLEPLSLRATLALARARAGVFQQAGGQIRELRLVPVATAYALLPDDYAAFAPLGALPKEDFTLDYRKQVALETTLAPAWGQHEAFLVELP